jgi:hypothetical protein
MPRDSSTFARNDSELIAAAERFEDKALALSSLADTAALPPRRRQRPAMITSSRATQLTGVATWCFAGQLQRVDHSQDFIEIPASCHWVNSISLIFLSGPMT